MTNETFYSDDEPLTVADQAKIDAAWEKHKAAGQCPLPPKGWRCTRSSGHEGPCAATPEAPEEAADPVDLPDARTLAQRLIEHLDECNRIGKFSSVGEDVMRKLAHAVIAHPPQPDALAKGALPTDGVTPELANGAASPKALTALLDAGAKNQRPVSKQYRDGNFNAAADAQFILHCITYTLAALQSRTTPDTEADRLREADQSPDWRSGLSTSATAS